MFKVCIQLVTVAFETFFNEQSRTKLIAFKDDDLIFEGWALNDKQKFIGWYGGGLDNVASLEKRNSRTVPSSFPTYTLSSTISGDGETRVNESWDQ